MKGSIFVTLEKFLDHTLGLDAALRIIEKSSRELNRTAPYVGPETYPDSELSHIINNTVLETKRPMPGLLRAFGRFCFPHLAAIIPNTLAKYKHPKYFIRDLDQVIHVEVRKISPGAEPPKFKVLEFSETRILLRYESVRSLDDLALGLLEGCRDYFGVHFEIELIKPQDNSVYFLLTFKYDN